MLKRSDSSSTPQKDLRVNYSVLMMTLLIKWSIFFQQNSPSITYDLVISLHRCAQQLLVSIDQNTVQARVFLSKCSSGELLIMIVAIMGVNLARSFLVQQWCRDPYVTLPSLWNTIWHGKKRDNQWILISAYLVHSQFFVQYRCCLARYWLKASAREMTLELSICIYYINICTSLPISVPPDVSLCSAEKTALLFWSDIEPYIGSDLSYGFKLCLVRNVMLEAFTNGRRIANIDNWYKTSRKSFIFNVRKCSMRLKGIVFMDVLRMIHQAKKLGDCSANGVQPIKACYDQTLLMEISKSCSNPPVNSRRICNKSVGEYIEYRLSLYIIL